MTCFFCETPLTGGIDTWGPAGGPEFCRTCWWEWEEYEARQQKIYEDYLKAEGLSRHWCATCHPLRELTT